MNEQQPFNSTPINSLISFKMKQTPQNILPSYLKHSISIYHIYRNFHQLSNEWNKMKFICSQSHQPHIVLHLSHLSLYDSHIQTNINTNNSHEIFKTILLFSQFTVVRICAGGEERAEEKPWANHNLKDLEQRENWIPHKQICALIFSFSSFSNKT